MERIIVAILLLTSQAGVLFATLTGQTYRIVPQSSLSQSLFVKDASLHNEAEVLLWTDTDVPAGQWQLFENGDNSYVIKNAYSRKILYRKGSAVEGAVVCQYDSTAISSNAAKWTLIGVQGQEGYYYITQAHKEGETSLFLEAESPNEGASIRLATAKTGAEAFSQAWKLELVEEAYPSLQNVRNELMKGWKARYYKRAATGYVLGNGGWWGDAEMFEVVLDAYETTADPAYETMFRELYKNFIYRNKSNWLYNSYNDDIAWMVIASIRAYLMFGDNTYLSYAKTNFDQMYARALLPQGMLRWSEDPQIGDANGTNSCINGPAEVAACYLAMALKDETYYEKAKSLYKQQRKYLYVPATGQVFDSFRWVDGVPSNYNHWASTYNQGTFLGAAVMLYNHYGDKQYKEDAEMIMHYTLNHLCDEEGIIKVCQVASGDLAGFKGILMRYVRRFIVDLGKKEYVGWMQKNARQAFNNRNSVGVTSSAWLSKTPESFVFDNCSENCDFSNDPFGPSTAVSVAFNAPLDANRITKHAFSTISSTSFDYLKGVYLEEENGATVIGNIKNGFYTAYSKVNFGNQLASGIEVRLSKSIYRGSAIEVRLGAVDGDLLATITVPRDGDDWQWVSQPIAPVSGLQKIYFLFKGTEGQNDLFQFDSFRFTTDTYLYPDITDNDGHISASSSVFGLSNLIDNRLGTEVSISFASNSWVQYESASPALLQAYTLVSSGETADKDLLSWKLQASNNGLDWLDLDVQDHQQWSERLQKRSYELASQAPYSFFRLLVTKNGGNKSEWSLSEWQLHAACLSETDITSDGGSLSAQYAGEELNTNPEALIDKNAKTKYLVRNVSDWWVDYKAEGVYRLKSYSLTSADGEAEGDPRNWTLYGSNDGVDWKELDRQEGQRFEYRKTTQYYPVHAEVGYLYYRLHVTDNQSADLTHLAEWQLFGDLYHDFYYHDMTINGGELTSSFAGTSSEELTLLTDNDANTSYVLSVESLPAWVQYKSTIPSRLLAYSIIAGYDDDKNPQNWTLQGSNDGATWTNIHQRTNISFSQRGERRTYTVSSSEEFTYFRLYVTKLSASNSNELILGEWELLATGITPTDVIGNGLLDAELPGVNSGEGVDKLSDKSENSKYCVPFYGSAWIEYQSPTPVKVTAYSITSANDQETRDPRAWTLEASKDGQDWVLIDSRSRQSFPYRKMTQYYACNEDSEEYSYFRLNITENNGAELLQIAEWQLLNIEGAGGSSGNLVQNVPDRMVAVYPNPVLNELQIELPVDGVVTIYSLTGQNCFTRELSAGRQIVPMGHCQPGVYMLRVQMETEIISTKIIKK